MRQRRIWKNSVGTLLAVLVFVAGSGTVFAVTSSSSNYQMVESQFNASGSSESCSGQYCARTTMGDLAVGDSASANYKTNFGSITPDEPSIEVIVEAGESNLGELTTERTATKTMVVKVRNYLSDGYTMQITGDPPKYSGHTLSTPGTPSLSQMGTEQFAINAVANTSPSVGANLVQLPSSDISFGEVDEDYETPNLFKYVSGDTVARSLSASGQTEYTISMIVNISNKTPAGHFTGDYSVVVIPAY